MIVNFFKIIFLFHNSILCLDRNQIIPKHNTVGCETGVMLRYPLVTMWF